MDEKIKKMRKLHVQLSWALLECKAIYYRGLKHKCPSDDLYDGAEALYKKLCKALGEKPTVSDMVDFDDSRASARLVREALSHGDPKNIGIIYSLKSKGVI